MSFIYQQDKNDYINKRKPLEQYSTGRRQSNKVSIDQQSAVKNNQPAQELNNQETNS
jgi:hypothetical protein